MAFITGSGGNGLGGGNGGQDLKMGCQLEPYGLFACSIFCAALMPPGASVFFFFFSFFFPVKENLFLI